jgi:alkanesulfonate monooxygenase SsuD/methylene tetrahydromethanopterin reductase-like flavin-dependent oxidoreductase (luciferase family)
LRRTARFANGWYPIGTNPQFPMGSPDLLEIALGRLGAYVEAEGRALSEIDIIYRTHAYELKSQAAGSASERLPFHGSADEIADDVRRYAALGVTHLVLDFTRASDSMDEVLERMEALATQVWPRV